MVCTDAEVASQVKRMTSEKSSNEGKIYRVLKCELIPYKSEAQVSDSESRLLASLDRLLSSGTFYFSAVGDEIGRNGLLNRCEKRAQGGSAVDSIFIWNHKLIRSMCEFSGDTESFKFFISPLMQGFALSRSFAEAGIWHTVTVISRRSNRQAGTRYNARGIDDEGNVAIFTETECIVTSSVGVEEAEVFSFVQIRGSVPVFWSQPSSVTVELNRNFAMTRNAFNRHLNWLKDRYDLTQHPLVFVNLLSTTKTGETLLTSTLKSHIQSAEESSTLPSPILVEFDFHKYVNASRPLDESLISLMDTLRPHIFHFGYFEDRPGQLETTGTRQRGIFRTNCLDCLDRTNAVQMQIAWEAVMLSKFSSFPKTSPQFKEIFTDVWVRNGDAISKSYSGTGSVLSRLVRTAGKGGNQIATMIEHSWRSANRFIAANWDDQERQLAICQLLGVQPNLLSPSIDCSLPSDLSVWVGTFNLHGRRVDEQRGALAGFIQEPADIVIACFQETIDLTAGSVLFSTRGDDERNRVIDLHLLSVLESLGGNGGAASSYVQVANESLVGLYITVFAKASLGPSIDAVKSRRFKAGFGGAAGNKGSVSITFRLFQSVEVEVVNLHLDSGEDRGAERMDQLSFILDNASCHKRSLLVAPQSHHHRNKSRVVFVCGDFNFRCDGISPSLAVQLVKKERPEKLRTYDPYLSGSSNVLKTAGFKEMPLTFNPTYKYEGGQLTERRTPSWCDRIFFRSHFSDSVDLDPMFYSSIQASNLSDHKPVVALFALRRNDAGPSASPQIPEEFNASIESNRSSVILHSHPPPVDVVDLLSGDPPILVPTINELNEEKDDDEFVDLLL